MRPPLLADSLVAGRRVVFSHPRHTLVPPDLSFILTVTASPAQISSGNSLQCFSRELFRIGKYFDLPRLMSFYFSATGYFVTNKLTTLAIYVLAATWLIIGLMRSEKVRRPTAGCKPPHEGGTTPRLESVNRPLVRLVVDPSSRVAC